MNKKLTAKAEVTIHATPGEVWSALVTPESIKQYMFGTDVESAWEQGSEITWRGEWQGKSYEDKGSILEFDPGRCLQYTHYSPLSGDADLPENYHTVTIELIEHGSQTQVVLSQDNNGSEQARAHSEEMWSMTLEGLRKLVEQDAAAT